MDGLRLSCYYDKTSDVEKSSVIMSERSVETNELDDVLSLIDRPQTPEEATAAFRVALAELDLSQRALAGKMKALGDQRGFDTILRGVQRMATGDARVSGEMQVILTQLVRERARAKRIAERTVWNQSDGFLTAEVDGVALSLSPQSRGRWQVHARLAVPQGYSPPIPHWRSSLEEAKLRAVLCVDETLDQASALERRTC